jgi:hypothetical protein
MTASLKDGNRKLLDAEVGNAAHVRTAGGFVVQYIGLDETVSFVCSYRIVNNLSLILVGIKVRGAVYLLPRAGTLSGGELCFRNRPTYI